MNKITKKEYNIYRENIRYWNSYKKKYKRINRRIRRYAKGYITFKEMVKWEVKK